MSGVVIIGAGHGGSQLAVSLRAEGYNRPITLIDAGAEDPYHKPPLSKTFLKSPDALPQDLRAASAYEQAKIRRLVGTVSQISVERRTVTLEGNCIAYDELVLATGARNRLLPELAGLSNVHTLRDLGDASRLRNALRQRLSVVVVGGGFIGLEVAAALSSMGHQVTVLEAAPRVLARVAAPEMSERVEAKLRALGIDLRTGWQGTEWKKTADRVTAAIGAEGQIVSDLVLVGIGAEANTALARAAGIACDRGVVTDACLRTSSPHVWALGDVAETPHWQADGALLRLESVQNATDQARHLARLIAQGGDAPFRTVPWFWSDVGPLKLQIAGLSNLADRRLVRAEEDKLAVFHFRRAALVSVETLNSPADHMLARQLLEAGKTPPDQVLLQGAAATKVWLTSGNAPQESGGTPTKTSKNKIG